MKRVKVHLVTGEVLESRDVANEDAEIATDEQVIDMMKDLLGSSDSYMNVDLDIFGGRSVAVLPLRSVLYVEIVIDGEKF